MKLSVFCIRDLKSDYHSLTTSLNDQVAMRDFKSLVLTDGTLFNLHRSDFELVRIGYFDTEFGIIEPCEKAVLMNGSDVREV